MDNNPEIIILMPIYNGYEFFQESFTSIIKQTYSNWKLLIGINGYEPYGEIYTSILKQITPFRGKYKIEIYDFGKPSNKPIALNKLMNQIYPLKGGEYIALLDVDDIWSLVKLQLQIKLIKKKYDIIGSNCVYFGDIENTIPTIPIGDFSNNYDFKFLNPIINSSVLIRAKYAYWDENSPPGLEDYNLWLKLKKNGNIRFFNLNNILVKHRIHQTSAFNNSNHNYVEELLSIY